MKFLDRFDNDDLFFGAAFLVFPLVLILLFFFTNPGDKTREHELKMAEKGYVESYINGNRVWIKAEK